MIRVQGDARADVGFDEVAILLECQEPCKRLPVEDRKLQLERRPRLAGPLYDHTRTGVALPSSAFFLRVTCPSCDHLVRACPPACIACIHFDEQSFGAVFVMQKVG